MTGCSSLIGPRIGSGGSTLHILRELQLRHGAAQLASWRVLLIHAGGYSKRLPSHSCSGKIFSPLPIETSGGGGAYQVKLETKVHTKVRPTRAFSWLKAFTFKTLLRPLGEIFANLHFKL